ncbi:hypothetical protein QZM46_08115 [Burkholderia vietnamiensis]|uniref:Uncharacterized protein n=1 Tax=Burkholderia vietnamiensis TaxID=60552 RepID=A0AAW7SX25_BURVI|nr:hypothetical protein [Burkholderia vietnamiensis]MBH9645846.1 hypothetical protein [Burkholderia vietnamiensis]MBR8008845.1 hypothetical protein [Burkholderia vietnamiensis]MDN7551297.1 hypothetical protein [Burkholderia vietnamiensis]MDN7795111.1 hypothetical protein [Burkholderia vietnamiensis]MDN8043623.1 hypothetical protein [Burkholderia vietnamiensis]
MSEFVHSDEYAENISIGVTRCLSRFGQSRAPKKRLAVWHLWLSIFDRRFGRIVTTIACLEFSQVQRLPGKAEVNHDTRLHI